MLDNLLWYSRYAVWVGAIVLLLQSVTGRSIGLVSLLAVILLAGGLLLFLLTLSWDSLPLARMALSPADSPLAASQASPGEARPNAAPTSTREPARSPGSARRLRPYVLTEDSPLVGAACSACGARLRAGQTIVRCPECSAVEHASCWTEDGSRCATENCSGSGELAVPHQA